MDDKYRANQIKEGFNQQAETDDAQQQERAKPSSVSDTASQELYLRDQISEEHDFIDERYREQVSRLAGQPLNTPSLGLGSDDPDTLHERYEALHTQWSRDRERLAQFEDYSTDRVRTEGATLSGEFEANASQIGLSHEHEVQNEQEQPTASAEFARSSNSKGHSL